MPRIDDDPMPLRRILRQVAERHGIPPGMLMTSNKTADLVRARHEFYYRALAETNAPVAAIGRTVGGSGMKTIYYGMTVHRETHNLPLPRGEISTGYSRAAQQAKYRKRREREGKQVMWLARDKGLV
jgi:hypothetical protein